MLSFLKAFLTHHFYNPNYLFFLIILTVMIVLPPFAELLNTGILIVNILFGLVVFTGALYASSNIKEFAFGLLWGGTGFLIFLFNGNDHNTFSLFNALFICIYFLFILWKIIEFILKIEQVNVNVIYACISGFLILGIGAAPLFSMLHNLIPGAFKLSQDFEFYEFLYFSFITITTIGFGDITPSHNTAKAVTMLFGIAGQLYLTFVVAIIIGKYLSNTPNEINPD